MTRSFSVLLFAAAVLNAAGVRVEYAPGDAATGPFPSDILTVADSRQRTGLRVNMPLPPDCSTERSTCDELTLINQLDGFNVQARMNARFSSRINPDTLRAGVYYIWLDQVETRTFPLQPVGTLTPINQVMYDPQTSTVWAKPDDQLEQARRYMIVVTDAVRDLSGDRVEMSDGFRMCLARQTGGAHCERLSDAVTAMEPRLGGAKIVAASIFTTLSATAFLEGVAVAMSNLGVDFQRTGATSFVNAAEVQSVAYRAHVRASGEEFENQSIPVTGQLLTQLGIGRIAFGSIASPNYLASPLPVIPQRPTGEAVTLPAGATRIDFHVFLPAGTRPAGGWPVVLFGHGLGDSRFGLPSIAGLALAGRGLAVVAMNAVGSGYGPRSVFEVRTSSDGTRTFPGGGRAADIDGDGVFGPTDGCIVIAPGAPYSIRDCLRQTAIDYIAMMRAIRAGMDIDGDGMLDLDAARVFYMSQSLGSFYGTLFNAIEPNVQAAVFNVGGGSSAETTRISPSFRPILGGYLAVRQPRLLNAGAGFDEQYTFRFRPVTILSVPGAAAIQEVNERIEWLEAQGAPVNYAPHLRSATLPGRSIKRIHFQIALGDATVPNPTNSTLLRAANMYEFATVYRHDIARQLIPALPANPHAYLAYLLTDPRGAGISLASFEQAGLFFLGDSYDAPDPNGVVRALYGRSLFEPVTPLIEGTNFLRP